MSGWIKLHRSLIDWEWYTDHNTTRLFVHCLVRANFEDKKWRGIDIKRGSFYTSLDTLSDETGLTPMQIRTSLKKLKSTGEVTGSGMARGRMITVVGYEEYQEDSRLGNRVATGSQQADNREVTANKNLRTKEDKNINPLGNGLPESADEISDEKKKKREARTNLINQAFDFFWIAWPTKKSKQKAFKSFVKVCGSKNDEAVEGLTNTLCADIDKRLQANDFGFDRMHATTYLNNKRWEDDISAGDYQ
jgi:hypothetical protein